LKNSQTPLKNSKAKPLTKEEKRRNWEISQIRIAIEHVICCLKRFKIISDRYRNRRKRFKLRFNLIAGIYNFPTIGLERGLLIFRYFFGTIKL
jgi:hypothetical protein